jgi:hypothetical protein
VVFSLSKFKLSASFFLKCILTSSGRVPLSFAVVQSRYMHQSHFDRIMSTKANVTLSSSKLAQQAYAKSITLTEELVIPLNLVLACQFHFSHSSLINTSLTFLLKWEQEPPLSSRLSYQVKSSRQGMGEISSTASLNPCPEDSVRNNGSEDWTNWPLSWRVHFDFHGEKVRSEEVVIAFGKEAIVLVSTSSRSVD